MARNHRIGLIVGGATVILAVIALMWPGEPAYVEWANDPDGTLEARLAAAKECVALKDGTVRSLAAGNISLAEAVDRFQEIDARHPEIARCVRTQIEVDFPADNYTESLARCIVCYCENRVDLHTSQTPWVTARLHGELSALIANQH
jgi:hypothetical protein